MSLKKWSPLLYGGAGMVAGLLLAFSLGADEHTGGRYQLKVWSQSPSSTSAGDHGAYRIDTETGTVWPIGSNAGKTPVD